MALGKSTVKAALGMRRSWFYPITAEPENAHPTYGEKLDMGAAVKGYLAVTTVTGSIPGDDIEQVSIDKFVSAQLDVETTMSDLEVNAALFGHTYSETGGEVSNSNDQPVSGGYACIEQFINKTRGNFYRVSCFYKTTPIASSEKQEADTRKSGEFSPKNNAVSLKVTEDNTGDWRIRQDFETQSEAEAFIATTFKSA